LDGAQKLSLWTSAIALAFLEKKFANEKVEWALIQSKIVKFVTRTLKAIGNAQATPEALFAAAKRVV